MLNIIKADLYRLVRSKGLYIAIALAILIAIISIVTLSGPSIGFSVGINADSVDVETMQKISAAKSLGEFRSVMKSIGPFELDRGILKQNFNLYFYFIAFVAIIITKDFSSKTVKNTLTSAISRKKYYISKILLVLGISTMLILFNNYFSYFLNLIVNGKEFTSSIGEITKITLYQLPLLYGIICLLVCIAFITRKTSIFNTISIPFLMVFQFIVITLTQLLRIKADWFTNYDLQWAMLKLANNPANDYILKCGLLGLIYVVIFGLIGYSVFKKAEI